MARARTLPHHDRLVNSTGTTPDVILSVNVTRTPVLRLAATALLCATTLPAQSSGPSISFRDVVSAAGLHFVLENHPTARKHMIETMPGGVATLDYDNDGRTDIYFTNGAAIPAMAKSEPKYFNRLFRNEEGMKFRDVTAEAGVAGAGYSMGVAAADYDNDGRTDLFVAGVHRSLLYHNLGNGRFEEVSARAGMTGDHWAVAAGWFDYDNDGRLDLFVVHYAKWSPAFDRYCGDADRKIRVYCHPKYFEPVPNRLYRNRGDGAFTDVTARSGIGAHAGRGMSVGFADYDNDGGMDAFVTNDNLPNFLFRNRGDGTFAEVALEAGVALLDHGKPVASMGVDFRDYDNDGFADLNITALTGETFPLFRNLGKGFFRDATYASRLGPLTTARSGWGNGFFDFDNDGFKDLFTANSHVNDRIEMFEATTYKQPNSVFRNLGNGSFAEVPAGLSVARAHRGAAFADFNQDGKVDIVVTALGEPAQLWENTSPGGNHWLILRLAGSRGNRDGIGARVRLGSQHNLMTSAVSYASSTHFGVHFGLGAQTTIDRLEIHWPSGAVQILRDVSADRVLAVREPAP